MLEAHGFREPKDSVILRALPRRARLRFVGGYVPNRSMPGFGALQVFAQSAHRK